MEHLETQVKASLRTVNTLQIIETLGEQDRPELKDDRVHVHGVLQSTCAKGIARHIVNRHEGNVDLFQDWDDSCEWFDGSENNNNNTNQLRFRLDALKLTTRNKSDQHIQDFLEIKTLLDELEKECTKSACISKFLGNVAYLDYAEDARALSRDESNLILCMKITYRSKRKIYLEREKNRSASG